MTIFDVAGFNGKRHWANDMARARSIMYRLNSGASAADIVGGNELNADMVAGMRKAGFSVKKGTSNDRPGRPWTGNAIAWDPELWDLVRSGEKRIVFRYWPGKKFSGQRFTFWKKMTIYFPWVVLQNRRNNKRIRVMVVHFPTGFNARQGTRNRIERIVKRWLTAKEGSPRVVIGDTNGMRLGHPLIHFVTIQRAVGIWINDKPRVARIGRVGLAGLTDHPVAPRARLRT